MQASEHGKTEPAKLSGTYWLILHPEERSQAEFTAQNRKNQVVP
jgi:hypothetical protein